MATQVIRTGEGIAVEIPEEMLRRANLAVGDPVEWRLNSEGDLALQAQGSLDGLLGSEEGYEEWKVAQIEAGFREIDAGNWIDGERVKEWVRSLGTDHRLPPPQ